MTGDDLACEVQARCDARVAEAVAAAEERAWHDGRPAGWGRCAEKVAEAIEADAGSHECAWGFDAVEIARRVGAEAQRSEGRVRRRSTGSDATCSQTKRPVTGRDDQL